jgi:hypothetical protein
VTYMEDYASVIKGWREYELDKAGREYVLGELLGGRTLAHAVAARLVDTAGEVFALLPFGATQEALLDFESGGKLPQAPATPGHVPGSMQRVPDDSEVAAGVVSTCLRQGGGVALFEDINGSPTDRAVVARKDWCWTLGEEVYYRATAQSSRDQISQLIRWSRTPFYSFLVVTAGPLAVQLTADARSSGVGEIAAAAQLVAVGAYDGESRIYWRTGAT